MLKTLAIATLAIFVCEFPAYSQKKTLPQQGCFIKTSDGRILTLSSCGSSFPTPRLQPTQTRPESSPESSQTKVLERIRNEPLFYTETGKGRFWDFLEGISNSRNLYISEDKYSETNRNFRIEFPLSQDIRTLVVGGQINCTSNSISLGNSATAYNPQNQPINRNKSFSDLVSVSALTIQKYCPQEKPDKK